MSRHTEPTTLPTFAQYRSQPDFGTSIDHAFDSWLIAPCGVNRDSDTLTRSNFEEQNKELEKIEAAAQPASEDAEYLDLYSVVRFNHWACGWVEHVLVRPDSRAAEYVTELAAQLADYPVVNEDAFSELEWNDAAESWENYGASDFRRALREKFKSEAPAVCDLLDERDIVTADHLRAFMEELYPNEPYFFDGGGCNFPIGRAVDECGRGELAAFIRKVRAEGKGAA